QRKDAPGRHVFGAPVLLLEFCLERLLKLRQRLCAVITNFSLVSGRAMLKRLNLAVVQREGFNHFVRPLLGFSCLPELLFAGTASLSASKSARIASRVSPRRAPYCAANVSSF